MHRFLPGPGGRHLSHRLRGRRHRGGLLCEASGIRPDTVLLSVDGRDVSAQRYLYWLAYACDYIADYYDSGEGSSGGHCLRPEPGGLRQGPGAAERRPVRHSGDLGGGLRLHPHRRGPDRHGPGVGGRAAQYGGEEAYLAVLARMGLDRAEAEAISGDYYLYEHLYDLYCTEGSELAPAEHDLETFAQGRATSPWTTSGSPPPLWTRRTRRPWPPAGPRRRRPFPS
ncbi:MAG: hypothetical protein ACLTYN_14665 [Dysosmobacter welbionis]